MIAKFLEFISNSAFSLLDVLFSALAPASAENYTGQIYGLMGNEIVDTSLSWVNYFLPIGRAAAVISAWGAVMLGYLAYRVVMGIVRTAD